MTPNEKARLIKEYCEQHPEPDQDCCPELFQRFYLKAGETVWSNKTGKRVLRSKLTIPYNQLYAVNQWGYSGFYIKCHEELKALEVARIFLHKTNRGKEGETVDWKFSGSYSWQSANRRFVFPSDTNSYSGKGDIFGGGRYYSKDFMSILGMTPSMVYEGRIIKREARKFDPNYDQPNDSWGTYYLREWYKKEFTPRTPSKANDHFLAYDLGEAPKYTELLTSLKYPEYIHFQVVDDQYAVLRMFRHTTSYGLSEGTKILPDRRETQRIFISAKGKPAVFWYEGGQWIRKGRVRSEWGDIPIANRKDIESWRPLKYISDLIDIRKNAAEAITTILRHPIIETVYKSGYPNIAKMLLLECNVAANLKYYFGCQKEGKGSLYKVLGVNKYALEALEKYLKEVVESHGAGSTYVPRTCAIKGIKALYGKTDISDLSKESIDLVFPVLRNDERAVWRLNSSMQSGSFWWGTNDDDPIEPETRDLFFKLARMDRKTEDVDVFRTYFDMRQVARRIGDDHGGIDIDNWHNVSDIMRIHDALIEIDVRQREEREARYNEQRRKELEERMKTFKRIQKDRIAKYEYEDKDFCIRMPKEPTDLIREGSYLHHCVGGYVNNHASGETDIIFLRRKEAEDTPFYTIEIRNDRVIQIHGAYNRWLGNNPEAIPFVYEWLEQLGVSYDKKLLLNRATGYSSSRENLPESYLLRTAGKVA